METFYHIVYQKPAGRGSWYYLFEDLTDTQARKKYAEIKAATPDPVWQYAFRLIKETIETLEEFSQKE